jgi:hypothetical protein
VQKRSEELHAGKLPVDGLTIALLNRAHIHDLVTSHYIDEQVCVLIRPIIPGSITPICDTPSNTRVREAPARSCRGLYRIFTQVLQLHAPVP